MSTSLHFKLHFRRQICFSRSQARYTNFSAFHVIFVLFYPTSFFVNGVELRLMELIYRRFGAIPEPFS